MWLSFIVSSFLGQGWVWDQSPTPLLASSSTSAPSPPSRCPLSGIVAAPQLGLLLECRLTPAAFGTDWEGAALARAQAPWYLVAVQHWGTLSIVLGKQQLLSQDPVHHKSPWSGSELLPVCIIFPVQLLFFTPACSFSLQSHKIIKINVCGMYSCA